MFFTTLTSHKHPKYNYSYVKSSTLPSLHWTVQCPSEPCENWVLSTPYNSWREKKNYFSGLNVSVQRSVLWCRKVHDGM